MNLRNKQERVEWKKWLKKNRDHLVIVCGVPADIVSDKERWLYLVEHGELDGPVVEEVVKHALHPLLKENVDVIVLGCTHFPALRPVIERITGSGVHVIDSSSAIARRTHAVLDAEALMRHVSPVNAVSSELQVWCSGDPGTFSEVASKVLGYPIVALQAKL